MIVCVRGAENHYFPDFREPRLELVMALVSHPTKLHPTQPKTYLRAHLLGQNKGPCDAWLGLTFTLTRARSRERARRAAVVDWAVVDWALVKVS